MSQKRNCKSCGKSCWGFRCRKCYLRGRHNSPSKRKATRKYGKRMR